MEKLANAVKLAIDKFEEEHGKLEVGNEFVTVFNNGILVISCEKGGVSIHFILGQPYLIDESIDIFENKDKCSKSRMLSIEEAMDKINEEHVEMKDGDEFVTVFNNGILVISCEESVVSIHSVVGQPYTVDETLSIYESEE